VTHAQRLYGLAAENDASMKRLKQAFPSAAETLPTGAKPLFSYEDEDPIEDFFRSAHPHRGSYPCPTSQPLSDGAPLLPPDITFKRVAVKQKQPCSRVVADSDDHTTLPPPEMDLRNAPGWGAYAANASVANAQKGQARGARRLLQEPHESFSSGAAASAPIQIVDFMPQAGRSAANLRASLSPRTASPPSCTSPSSSCTSPPIAQAAAISQPQKHAANNDAPANLGEGSIFKRLTPAQMLRGCTSVALGGGEADIIPPKPPATIKRSHCLIHGMTFVCVCVYVCVCV
jgi:hypothetical protein